MIFCPRSLFSDVLLFNTEKAQFKVMCSNVLLFVFL